MKTIKVSYGGFETEQQVDECLYKAIYDKAIDDFAEQLRVHCALRQERGYIAETFEKLMKNVFEYAEELKKDGGENESCKNELS